MRTWHVITGEYPPQPGGVSDYVYLLSGALAAAQDEVHIWCPSYEKPRPDLPGVTVHDELGRFAPSDLRNMSRQLDRFPKPRRLLVQWVPHAFGYKSLNIVICLWLWNRARRGDSVDVMVHEPYLPFKRKAWRQNAAAWVHRLMTVILLRGAHHVWLSIPGWRAYLEPYAPSRPLGFDWLPVPSSVPVRDDAAAAGSIHRQFASDGLLVGHFGTYGGPIAPMLHQILPACLRAAPDVSVLLMGGGSQRFRDDFVRQFSDWQGRVHAAGYLDQSALSNHLAACDVLVQPYPDGVSSRRTTVMAALAHGRPTVTTSGALTEPLWKSSGGIALAPAGDTEGFVRSLMRLLEDPAERTRMGKAARELYRSQFDIRHIVDLLHEKI